MPENINSLFLAWNCRVPSHVQCVGCIKGKALFASNQIIFLLKQGVENRRDWGNSFCPRQPCVCCAFAVSSQNWEWDRKRFYELWPVVLGVTSNVSRSGLLEPSTGLGLSLRKRKLLITVTGWNRRKKDLRGSELPHLMLPRPQSCKLLLVTFHLHRGFLRQFFNRFESYCPSAQVTFSCALHSAQWQMQIERQAQLSHFSKKLKTFKKKQGDDRDLGNELKVKRRRRSLVQCPSQ